MIENPAPARSLPEQMSLFPKPPRLVPRFIRMRDAPSYLGMDKNRFNRDVLSSELWLASDLFKNQAYTLLSSRSAVRACMDYTDNRNREAIWRLGCRDRKALPASAYSDTLARLLAAHIRGAKSREDFFTNSACRLTGVATGPG
jgi:hypothetical protein